MSRTDVHIPGFGHVQMCPNLDSDILKKKIHKQLQIFFSDDVLKSKNNGKHIARSTQHSTAYTAYIKLYLLPYMGNILTCQSNPCV